MVSKLVHTHECGPEPHLAGYSSTCISVHKPKGRVLFYFFIEVLLIYNVVLVSGVQQSDLVLCIWQEDSLEKKMATHSSILAWKIRLKEELGGL